MENPGVGGKAIEKTDDICNHPGMRKTLLSMPQEKRVGSNKYKLNEHLRSQKHHKQSHKGRTEKVTERMTDRFLNI